MYKSLHGRIAIVTGATSGIGYATAKKLAESGVKVIGSGRREDRLLRLEAEFQQQFGEKRFYGFAGDLSKEAVVEGLLDRCRELFNQGPDIFVVNAGKGLPGSVVKSDKRKWQELFEINYMSALLQMRLSAESMLLRREQARNSVPEPLDIIVLGSIVGRVVSPVNPVYGATKFALHSLAESLRQELSPKAIRVTLIEPGTVQTEFQGVAGYEATAFKAYEEQIGPLIQGEDIANFISFAVSQPYYVHLSDVVIRPTRQVFP